MFELIITPTDNIGQSSITSFIPAVVEDLTWTTERKGVPGKLEFKVVKDDALKIEEGYEVRVTENDEKVFLGYIFSIKGDKEPMRTITAYDQIRYLKNKDTYVYENKTASDVIRMVAADFMVNVGYLETTYCIIASRIEDNSTALDIIYNALDIELTNTGRMYVLYDDFGKLTLKSLDTMKVGLLIDITAGENFDYTSSIDDKTYNKIKLSYDNKDMGTRDIYIAQDSANMRKWGILQYFDKIQQGENGTAKANSLLSLYNNKTRTLKLTNLLGDNRVRAGSLVAVKMDIDDIKFNNFMLVEKCSHNYQDNVHLMNLTLRGGAINTI